MQKINLLYVITKLELGGAQKQLLSIISNLDRQRFNVFLFTAKNGVILGDALSIDELTLKRSEWLERPINPFKDILALFEIYRFIRKNNIQIVHTHSSKAGILGRLAAQFAKVKFILHTVHGWSFNEFQPPPLRKIYIGLERLAASFTDKLVVVSYYDKQKGLRNRIGNEKKYHLLRYGIDGSEFSLRDENIRKELGIAEDDLVVGMVSCLKPQKAPQDFIRLASLARKEFPNVKFILAGDGPLRSKIKDLINRLSLDKNIILTGWRRDINRVLSAMDVFVLPSLWEGLPIAALEAIVSSIPVIATNTGGIAEVVLDNKTGFLVSPGDIQGMASRLIFLLKDRDARSRIAINAKNNLDGCFALKNMINGNQDLYESLLCVSN